MKQIHIMLTSIHIIRTRQSTNGTKIKHLLKLLCGGGDNAHCDGDIMLREVEEFRVVSFRCDEKL